MKYKLVPHHTFGSIGVRCMFAKNYGKNERSLFDAEFIVKSEICRQTCEMRMLLIIGHIKTVIIRLNFYGYSCINLGYYIYSQWPFNVSGRGSKCFEAWSHCDFIHSETHQSFQFNLVQYFKVQLRLRTPIGVAD